jgi:hypothetical protein
MRRTLVSGAALAVLAATAAGAIQITAQNARVAWLPPAVIQAWS